jgi:hypothetical protein
MDLGSIPPSLILPMLYTAPADGATISPVLGNRVVVLDNAALISTLTIALPNSAAALNGQIHSFFCTGGVTTLTVTGVGFASVLGAPTSLAANSFFSMICSFSKSAWLRIG